VLFEVLFETALDVKDLEGAATAQEAEAKAQTVAEVKRILRLMVKGEHPWASTFLFLLSLHFSYSLLKTAHAPYASVYLGYTNLETD
jgi:hypothetical protein